MTTNEQTNVPSNVSPNAPSAHAETNAQTQVIRDRLNIPRQPVPKQKPGERIQNFDETYLRMDMDAAIVEAARCIDCPSAPCTQACPVHNDIPSALKLLEDGDFLGAAGVFRQTSTLPEMCGRLCPQESLCEGACVVGFAIRPDGTHHPPVAIGRLESFITDSERQEVGRFPVRFTAPSTGRSVAIVGSGPAGMTVAEELQARGHSCTIFDMWPEPGGVLRYGIPNFKMSKEILEGKLQALRDMGVTFVNNTRVGKDISLVDLHDRDDFDAIFIGTGAGVGNQLRLEGEELANVYQATDFLVRGNLRPEELPEGQREKPYIGTDVVVVGGGDTSMDCVRTAIRQGALSVKCLYRRDRANMPGSQREVANAEEEGVEFLWLSAPKAFTGGVEVEGVMVQKMRLGAPDATGRQAPEVIEGADYVEPAELVIQALGFEPEDLPTLWGVPELAVTRWGTIKADFRSHATSLPGVYAAGDIVRGASLVVWAIRDGREAAEAILSYLAQTEAVAAE